MIVVTLRDEIAENFQVKKYAEIVDVFPVGPNEDTQLETSTYRIQFNKYEIDRSYLTLYSTNKDGSDHLLAMTRYDLLQNFMMDEE